MIRIRHHESAFRDRSIKGRAIRHDLPRSGSRVRGIFEQRRGFLIGTEDLLKSVQMMREPTATADARRGVGVSSGGFVEELATLGARRAGISHRGAEIGHGRKDALDDVDAAFVEGTHRDRFPGRVLNAEVDERCKLDDHLITAFGSVAVLFEKGVAEFVTGEVKPLCSDDAGLECSFDVPDVLVKCWVRFKGVLLELQLPPLIHSRLISLDGSLNWFTELSKSSSVDESMFTNICRGSIAADSKLERFVSPPIRNAPP